MIELTFLQIIVIGLAVGYFAGDFKRAPKPQPAPLDRWEKQMQAFHASTPQPVKRTTVKSSPKRRIGVIGLFGLLYLSLVGAIGLCGLVYFIQTIILRLFQS